MKKINIAIDGLCATGKGESAKFLAKELNYHKIDSGAMYRCTTLELDRKNIKPSEVSEIDLSTIKIEIGENEHMYLNNEDVEHEIRTQKISNLTPKYAKEKIIRYFVNSQLKEIVKKKGCIAEGRDIASHVIPDAEVKLFLIGDSQIRAKRRQEQLRIKGILENVEDVRKDLEARDHQDIHRDIAPLEKHEHALEIDTSTLSLDQQNELLLNIVKKYLKE